MSTRILLVVLAIFLFSACDGSKPRQDTAETEEAFVPPPPGTLIAADSTEVKDGLNNFKFTVKVLANEYTNRGTYTVKLGYGPNENESMFTLPKGGAHLPISLRKNGEYSYIIGFTYLGEFFNYYEAVFQPGHPPSASVKNIKAYALQ
jgi:hypothetical protein